MAVNFYILENFEFILLVEKTPQTIKMGPFRILSHP